MLDEGTKLMLTVRTTHAGAVEAHYTGPIPALEAGSFERAILALGNIAALGLSSAEPAPEPEPAPKRSRR